MYIYILLTLIVIVIIIVIIEKYSGFISQKFIEIEKILENIKDQLKNDPKENQHQQQQQHTQHHHPQHHQQHQHNDIKIKMSDEEFSHIRHQFKEINFNDFLTDQRKEVTLYFPENFNWISEFPTNVIKVNKKYYVPQGLFNINREQVLFEFDDINDNDIFFIKNS